jgi:hypothetical protein
MAHPAEAAMSRGTRLPRMKVCCRYVVGEDRRRTTTGASWWSTMRKGRGGGGRGVRERLRMLDVCRDVIYESSIAQAN